MFATKKLFTASVLVLGIGHGLTRDANAQVGYDPQAYQRYLENEMRERLINGGKDMPDAGDMIFSPGSLTPQQQQLIQQQQQQQLQQQQQQYLQQQFQNLFQNLFGQP